MQARGTVPTWMGLLTAALLAAGCGAQQSNTTTTENPDNTSTATTERTDFESQAEQRLAQLDAEVDSLKMKLDQATGGAKQELAKRLDEVDSARRDAHAKMDQLRSATTDTWENTRQEMAQLLESLDRHVDQMKADLASSG